MARTCNQCGAIAKWRLFEAVVAIEDPVSDDCEILVSVDRCDKHKEVPVVHG